MRTIKWELPFKNMHYLNSLTADLAESPHIILITGVQDEEGNINRCVINIRQSDENMDNVILNIGAIIGKHEAKYESFLTVANLVNKLIKEKAIEEEIAVAQEQEEDGGPKGEDFEPNISDEEMEKELPSLEVDKPEIGEIVEKKELVEEVVEITEEESEEEVEKVVKEIVEIAPKVYRAKDSKFRAKLRVILNNFKK